MARTENLNDYEPDYELIDEVETIISEWDWPEHYPVEYRFVPLF